MTIDDIDPHSNFYYDYKHAVVIGNSDYSLLAHPVPKGLNLALVKETLDHFCENIVSLLGFDPGEEVTKLVDTNWLATTGTFMKL